MLVQEYPRRKTRYVYDVVVRIIIYYCRHLTHSFFVSVHDQILFGAGDVDYCVLLGLASFMEYSIEQGWDQSSDHLFCLDGLNCPITIKDRVLEILSEVLADPTFIEILIQMRRRRSVPI